MTVSTRAWSPARRIVAVLATTGRVRELELDARTGELLKIEDLRPLIESRPVARTVTTWFDQPTPGEVPAGALVPVWLPS